MTTIHEERVDALKYVIERLQVLKKTAPDAEALGSRIDALTVLLWEEEAKVKVEEEQALLALHPKEDLK